MRFAVSSLLFLTLLVGCVVAAPLSTANSKNNDSDSLKRQINDLSNTLNPGTVLGSLEGMTGNLGGVTGGLAGGKPQLGGSGLLSGIPLLGGLLDGLTGAVPAGTLGGLTGSQA